MPLQQAQALAAVLAGSEVCDESARIVAESVEALIVQARAALERFTAPPAPVPAASARLAAPGRPACPIPSAAQLGNMQRWLEQLHAGLVLANEAFGSASQVKREHAAWLLDGLVDLSRHAADELGAV